MAREPKDMSASVRQRLLNRARERGEDFQLVLTHYAVERLLYRLSHTRHGERFVLKGAMLFSTWLTAPHRPTHDLDLLGKGDPSVSGLAAVFRDVCKAEVEEDGILFDAESVSAGEVRDAQEYGGVRVKLVAGLAGARIPLRIDIGFGDVVTPGVEEIEFPAMLGFPAPRVAAYPPETVIAEKLHATVTLGSANSRMKDFYDLWALARERAFDGQVLRAAVKATFERRGTAIPNATPLALTPAFSEDDVKQAQWKAFMRRADLSDAAVELGDVSVLLNEFLTPVLRAAAQDQFFKMTWKPAGPWSRPE